MRTIGIGPQNWVLLLERRDLDTVSHRALVIKCSMDEQMKGPLGEYSIDVVFGHGGGMLPIQDVVHFTHHDWMEGRTAFAYEELPSQPPGVCRFCLCTQNRACAGGCSWADDDQTVCNSPACLEKWVAELEAAHDVDE